MRISVSAKLWIGFGTVLVLMGVVVYAGLSYMGAITEAYEEAILRISQGTRLAERIDRQVMVQELAVARFVAGENASQQRSEFNSALALARQAFDELGALSELSEQEREIVLALSMLQDDYARYAEQLFTTFQGRDTIDYLRLAPQLRNTRASLGETVARLVQVQNDRLQEALDAAERASADASRVMRWLALLAIAVCAAFAVAVSRRITRPVKQVAQAAARLAGGDLTQEVLRVRSGDEIGDMARTFNRMLQGLRELVSQVAEASERLLGSNEEMTRTAEEAARATHQIAETIQQVAAGTGEQSKAAQETAIAVGELQKAIDQIASGAQDQARAVEEATGVMKQIASSIERVAENVAAMSQAAERTVEVAREGGERVRLTVSGIEEIRTTVLETAGKVEELGSRSQRVGEIVQVISDIADQTNLLALNAAIEAARAGEHGKGFAVVADEVRKLAERSAESAEEIAGLIRTMQAGVDEAVGAMKAGTAKVESGTELAQRAGEALEEILAAFEELNGQIQRISVDAQEMREGIARMKASVDNVAAVTEENTAAAEEMAAQSEQVTRAVENISSIAEETAASTQEVSASTEELSASATTLASKAEQVAEMARELRRAVSAFKV